MLKKLVVKNMAIIEDLTINFDSKMTVLTGETGAGKSLIIDTISLLLGARADVDMIRYQEHMLMVMGVFDMNAELIDIFKK
ncbi:TPA: AAA family ATPase, partial [Candidatus Avacholeplasma faecigallinarum]|nr:AAA family ATPase [Candidatus Avacholeplasma faecigallinarum]